jgi:threonine/homoserine/homoserine lactone efflux protein
MSFAIYLIGYAIFVIGLAVGAHMMHMPPRWIGVGVLVFTGLGILKAVSSTRQRDPN